MEIHEKCEVGRCGAFAVMEGEVSDGMQGELSEERQEFTAYWVERNGKVVSGFRDIDYANIRARMLDVSERAGIAPPPDLYGGIDVFERSERFTILSGNFGVTVYWVVDGEDVISDWGDLRYAHEFIAQWHV